MAKKNNFKLEQVQKELLCVEMKPSTSLNLDLIDNIHEISYNRWYREEKPTFKVNSLDWLPNGERLLLSADDKYVRIFDLSGEELCVIGSAKHGCDLARMIPDGNTAVMASKYDFPRNNIDCHKIRHLDVHSKAFIHYYSGHDQQVTSISVNPNHQCLLSSSMDGTVRLWDNRLNAGVRSGDRQAFAVLRSAHSPIACFDPLGIIFAVATQNQSIRLYDIRKYSNGPFKVKDLSRDSFNGEWHQIKFSPDGKMISLSTTGTKMPIVDSYTLESKMTLSGMKNALEVNLDLTWATDSQLLFSGSSSSFPKKGDYGNLNMFNVNGEHLKCWKTNHVSPTRCVSFNPQYYVIAIACEDLSLWVPEVKNIIKAVDLNIEFV